MKSIYRNYVYTTDIKLMEVKGLTKHVCTHILILLYFHMNSDVSLKIGI